MFTAERATIASSPHQPTRVWASKQVDHPHIIGDRCRCWWRPASLLQSAAVVSRWRYIDCCHPAPAPTICRRRQGRWPPLCRGWSQDGVNSDGSSLLYRPACWYTRTYIIHFCVYGPCKRSIDRKHVSTSGLQTAAVALGMPVVWLSLSSVLGIRGNRFPSLRDVTLFLLFFQNHFFQSLWVDILHSEPYKTWQFIFY